MIKMDKNILILNNSDCFKETKLFLEKNYDLSKINKFNFMTVLKEAVNNIFEHGKPPGKLEIEDKEKFIKVYISDESQGFDFYNALEKSIKLNENFNFLEDSRGIFLITHLSDEYKYENKVLIIKFYKEVFNEDTNC